MCGLIDCDDPVVRIVMGEYAATFAFATAGVKNNGFGILFNTAHQKGKLGLGAFRGRALK